MAVFPSIHRRETDSKLGSQVLLAQPELVAYFLHDFRKIALLAIAPTVSARIRSRRASNAPRSRPCWSALFNDSTASRFRKNRCTAIAASSSVAKAPKDTAFLRSASSCGRRHTAGPARAEGFCPRRARLYMVTCPTWSPLAVLGARAMPSVRFSEFRYGPGQNKLQ